MKKVKICICCAIIAALLLTGCGNITNVTKVIGPSDYFTHSDIDSAMNVVIGYFMMEFDGCTLTRIEYQDSKCITAGAEWAEQYGEEQAIVLYSSFKVGPSGGDGSLNPNSDYNNWSWVLTRSGDAMWKLQTWGYG